MPRWVIERMTATWEGASPEATGEAVADAMRREADAIAADAQLDHATIAHAVVDLLPIPDDRPLQLLVHGDPGAMTHGGVSTGIGAITMIATAGRKVRVWVTETRPYLEGARLAAWELSLAGVDYTILPDSAVGYLLEHEKIDAVLLGAEWIAANGDTANVIGSRAVAELAAIAPRDDAPVPVYVCAPATTIDPQTQDGRAIPVELRPGRDLSTYLTGFRTDRITALNPATDVVPATRISAIVTEEGVLRAPFPEALAAAHAARESRRPPPQAVASPAAAPTPPESS
jgi:methylthioribose-1-phosphate isomerase